MTKKFLTLVVLVLAGIVAHAQTTNKIAFSLSGDINLPGSSGVPGPGFTLKAEVPVIPNLKFMVSAGYFSNGFGKRLYTPAEPPVLFLNINTPNPTIPTGPANGGPYEFVPVKAGLRFYYFKSFYVDAEAGEAFKANVTDNSFVYGGSMGWLLRFNPHHALDISAGYSNGYKLQDYDKKIDEVSFRVGYRFQF